jgi:membrane protease YdiL (CAAX protease family)
VGWFFFARSMAAKAVTLVTVPTSSGEWEKIPWGRRWATLLGMLTFAVGVLTRQWPLALTGIVYSTMTAAAMWQNFRARLPYLYDPWSERRPEVPALMHGMIAISLMVESGAVLSGIAMGLAGTNLGLVMRPAIYGVCGLAVSVAFWVFLAARGVRLRDIVHWGVPAAGWAGLFGSLAAGGLGGLLLGFLARGYLALMQHLPFAAELMQRSQEQMARNPELHVSFALVAVAVVPFTEEFLFRGLLFRSLDREWGGWRAVLGSAAFFAIYHPPLAWPMVVLVGAANALLFKRSGWLVPAVVLHMVYNAVVTYTSAPEL